MGPRVRGDDSRRTHSAVMFCNVTTLPAEDICEAQRFAEKLVIELVR
jgi:hypothetical protein